MGFRADELALLLELLAKPRAGEEAAAAASKAAAAAASKPRLASRPKAVSAYKYGEIKIEPKNIANYECKGIVAKWDLFDAPEYEEVLNLFASQYKSTTTDAEGAALLGEDGELEPQIRCRACATQDDCAGDE